MDIEKAVFDVVEKYGLFGMGDRVGVAVSGGKDSIVLLYVLKKLGYDVVGIMLDLEIGSWSRTHLENVRRFCSERDIELRVFGFREYFGEGFGDVLAREADRKGVSRCSVCGVAKKWGLNRFAREAGVDVLATGHNLDDECQNVLMNFLKGNVALGSRCGPRTGGSASLESRGLNFVQRVKPFFFVPESEILKYSKLKGFDILYDKCPNAVDTYRVKLREWMDGEMSDEEKLGVLKGFVDAVRDVEFDVGEVGKCERCGEVSKKRVCGFCEIVLNV